MSFDTQTGVGSIAAEHPAATRVFARHGIDYCCGGGVALADSCAARRLNPTAVLEEIRLELRGPAATPAWNEEQILFPMMRHGQGPFAEGPGTASPSSRPSLHEHVHLEHIILFPQALAGRA